MHVEFDYTPDDLVDASKRIYGRSKVVGSSQSKQFAGISFWVWLLLFLILYRTSFKGALLSGIVAMGCALLILKISRREIENRLRKIAAESFGNAKSLRCEVELRPEGVWIRSMNRQTLFEWPSVEEIRETADSVDIFTRDSGVVVRNRAFSSPEQRLKFVELARAGAGPGATSESETKTV